jgi:hypothetical protein
VSEAVLVFLLAMLAFLVFWPLFTGVPGSGILGTLYSGYCIERRLKATKSSLLGASAPGERFLQAVVRRLFNLARV